MKSISGQKVCSGSRTDDTMPFANARSSMHERTFNLVPGCARTGRLRRPDLQFS